MHLFVVGAGHAGLVTAVGFARLGHRVTVADLDAGRIGSLRGGRAPVYEPGLDEAIAATCADGRLSFTTDLDPPPEARYTFVCVNTPAGPDGPLSTVHVEAALARLLTRVGAEHTIVIRSTLPLDGPGRLAALAAGVTSRAAIVTNPEFMREGQALEDFDHPNRVVTGWLTPRDAAAAQAVVDLYAPLGAPSMLADARSVALIKLGSNVFLGMKVQFANELARLADATGADVAEVIAGIGLDARIGSSFMRPGPGLGGSCLPEQAVAIAQQTAALGVDAPLLSAVHRSNAIHQREIVARLDALLGGPGALVGRRIGLLGLAFKANTDDVRQSPALALAARLREAGALVVAHDPRAEARARLADPDLTIASSALEALRAADAASSPPSGRNTPISTGPASLRRCAGTSSSTRAAWCQRPPPVRRVSASSASGARTAAATSSPARRTLRPRPVARSRSWESRRASPRAPLRSYIIARPPSTPRTWPVM